MHVYIINLLYICNAIKNKKGGIKWMDKERIKKLGSYDSNNIGSDRKQEEPS